MTPNSFGGMEYFIRLDSTQAEAAQKHYQDTVKETTTVVESEGKRMSTAAAGTFQRMTTSMTGAVLAGQVLFAGFERLTSTINEFTIGSAKFAGRTQTMAVVMDQLAKVNGLGAGAVRAQADEIRKLGITTQESYSTVSKMIQANFDLRRSTDLARLAQNAAVIAGVNSSQALEGILQGIVTRQPEVLRTYGLVVDFEAAFARAAKERHRALSSAEKQEIALQTVLLQGARIAGAYEASMLTAGKQLTSLARYSDEAKNAIGEGLVPALGRAVDWMTRLGKYATENGEQFSRMTVGVTALAAAGAAFRFMPGPLPLKAVAAAVAGGATWFAGRPDEVEYWRGQGTAAIENLMRQRDEINRKLGAGNVSKMDAESLRAAFDANKEALNTVVRTLADNLAKVYMERGKGVMFEAERLTQTMDLGRGVKVSSGEILMAMQARRNPDRSGALFNQEAYDKAVREGLAADAAEKFRKRAEEIRNLVDALDQKGLDPLARLFVETTARLQAIVQKNGPLTAQEIDRTTKAYRAAFYRQMKAPEMVAIDRRETGFLYGSMPSVAQMVEVDPQISAQRSAAFIERARQAAQASVDYQVRKVQLMTGPGGELEAVRRITELRLAGLEQQRRMGMENLEFEMRRADILRDAEMEVLEQQKRRFDDIKEQAGRVFDALLTRSQSFGDVIKNILRTAFLTPIRDFASTWVATLLSGMRMSPARAGAAMGGAPAFAGGGTGGWTGALASVGMIGGGGGGFGFPGAPGGTVGFAGPVGSLSSGTAAGGSPLGGFGSMGAGYLANLKSFLGMSGSIATGAGTATTWGAASMTQKLSALGKSNAALLGGGMLAYDGLRRGGALGVAETTAGGALIGFKFGGPLGAAIGATVGLGAGLVRLFMKSGEEKVREKIRSLYGIDVNDKGILRQIVDLAKANYGGNLDLAIRSKQIRELLELYSQATGQRWGARSLTATPISLSQSASGAISIMPTYRNGEATNPWSVGGPTPLSSPLSAGSVSMSASFSFDGPTTERILSGRVVEGLRANPREVAGAVSSAYAQNYSRRQNYANMVAPGLVTA